MRSLWPAAIIAALVILVSAPAGVAAPAACPGGYTLTPVGDNQDYGAADNNKSGKVCVQTVPKKGAAPKIIDDHLGKKG